MPYIPQIKIGDATYDVKDATARKDVSYLKSALNPLVTTSQIYLDSGVINTGSVGETITLNVVPNASYSHVAIKVKVGEGLRIVSGQGGTSARLWCVTDDELTVLKLSESGAYATDNIIIADEPGYIIVNVRNESNPIIYLCDASNVHETYNGSIESFVKTLFDTNTMEIADLSSYFIANYIRNTNVEYNQLVPFNLSFSENWYSVVLPCEENDVFIVNGRGGANALLYAFTDTDHKLIQKSQPGEWAKKDMILIAPNKGYVVINSVSSGNPSLRKYVKKSDDGQYKDYTLKFVSNCAIRTPDTVGAKLSTLTPESFQDGACCIVDVKSGDRIRYIGRGFDAYRAWCFITDEMEVAAVANSSVSVDGVLIAPSNGKLILNCRTTHDWFAAKKEQVMSEQIINAMNGGFGHQYLAPIIPDNYSPTENSFDAISEIINVTNPTVAEIYSLYDGLMALYPSYISKEELPYKDQSGTYSMYCYTFAPEQMPIHQYSTLTFALNELPKVILGTGTHGNGDTGDGPTMVATLYCFLRDLCANWKVNESLKYLRWNVVFKIIPLQNPWGYQNRTRKNSRGVDINRNMPSGWFYTSDPSSAGYGGESPLSENESKNIKYVLDQNANALIYYDMHSRMERVPQSRMMYYDVVDSTPIINVFRSTMPYVNYEWQKINANLPDAINGDMTLGLTGAGKIFAYANSLGINGAIIEGFFDYEGNNGTAYDINITEMMLRYFGITLFHSLRFFHDNYYPGMLRQAIN